MKRRIVYALLGTVFGMMVACNNNSYPDGFERIAGAASTHFVYIDQTKFEKRLQIMTAARRLCDNSPSVENCDIYFWFDKSKVPTAIPLTREEKETNNGYYLRSKVPDHTSNTGFRIQERFFFTLPGEKLD